MKLFEFGTKELTIDKLLESQEKYLGFKIKITNGVVKAAFKDKNGKIHVSYADKANKNYCLLETPYNAINTKEIYNFVHRKKDSIKFDNNKKTISSTRIPEATDFIGRFYYSKKSGGKLILEEFKYNNTIIKIKTEE